MIRTCVAVSLALATPSCRVHPRPEATDRLRCVVFPRMLQPRPHPAPRP